MSELTQKIAKQRFIKILGSPRSGGNISFASKVVGFSRQTIASWRRLDASFDKEVSEAIMQGKAMLADEAFAALVKLVRRGNVTAVIFTLKTLCPERWNEKRFTSKASLGETVEDRYELSPKFLESLKNFSERNKKKQLISAG